MKSYKEAKAMLRKEIGEDFLVSRAWECADASLLLWCETKSGDIAIYKTDKDNGFYPILTGSERVAALDNAKPIPLDYEDVLDSMTDFGRKQDRRIEEAWELPDKFIFITVPAHAKPPYFNWTCRSVSRIDGDYELTGTSTPLSIPPNARRIV